MVDKDKAYRIALREPTDKCTGLSAIVLSR